MDNMGQIAYEAYRKQTGGKSLVSSQPIPEWAQLPADIQAAWIAAADAVVSHVLGEEGLDGDY